MNKPHEVDSIEQLNNWQNHILDTMPTIVNPASLNLFLTEQHVLATLELAKQIAALQETFKKKRKA
jgi:hypothetical protein